MGKTAMRERRRRAAEYLTISSIHDGRETLHECAMQIPMHSQVFATNLLFRAAGPVGRPFAGASGRLRNLTVSRANAGSHQADLVDVLGRCPRPSLTLSVTAAAPSTSPNSPTEGPAPASSPGETASQSGSSGQTYVCTLCNSHHDLGIMGHG
jgi:hypothetical protein